ncbi:MAG: alanine--tRNA ligase [bacterium]|nr:alanine--tRNA ligase [bacterium]
MTSKEIWRKFLEFMEGKGHRIVPSSSLVPTDDSVLLTTAGMQQFKPYYTGEKSAMDDFGSLNTASIQKCARTSDIEEVGDETHLTFFEMLGNFSFGGYFKKEAIAYAHEFITKEMGLEIDYVSVFAGDDDIPMDEESEKIWREIDGGIEIKKFGREDNFWGPTGEEGPCGPTTEIYVGGVEIWNLVFNEYFCGKDGKFRKLETPGVDTGMGLERLAVAVQNVPSVFETDLFAPIMDKINELSESGDVRAKRVVADHIKAGVFMISDGIAPSNVGRGYILRRLIRRAVRYGKLLGAGKRTENMPSSPPAIASRACEALRAGRTVIEGNSSRRQSFDFFTGELAQTVIGIYKDTYPELEKNKEKIFEELQKEEEKFGRTLEKGLKVLDTKIQASIGKAGEGKYKVHEEKFPFEKFSPYLWSGRDAFNFYQTYGFPFELLVEELIARQEIGSHHIPRLREEFNKEAQKHQELSKTASAGMFKGGLADSGEEAAKLHTATHLLQAALREVLGEHIVQKGSNVTAERLRFDFSHPEKLTDEQKRKVEEIVNEKIKENLPVVCEEMSVEEAKAKGAIGVFDAKYGDKVKVYSIGDPAQGGQVFSREICGGPHAKTTGELGRFKIKKEEEEASSAGVRRIKAILE